jgi:hypothetical protein
VFSTSPSLSSSFLLSSSRSLDTSFTLHTAVRVSVRVARVHIFLPLQITVSALYAAVEGHSPLSLSFKIPLHACELLSEQHLLHDPSLRSAPKRFHKNVSTEFSLLLIRNFPRAPTFLRAASPSISVRPLPHKMWIIELLLSIEVRRKVVEVMLALFPRLGGHLASGTSAPEGIQCLATSGQCRAAIWSRETW